MKRNTIVLSLVLLVATGIAHAGSFTIDQAHSDVSFKVRHLVSKTSGQFTDFNGTIVADFEKLDASSVVFTIKTASIDRKDYGIVWNKALDAGGMILGDEVEISINLETKSE